MSDITSTIYAHTSIKSGLTVKRKFKTSRNSPQTVTRWWFVISGEENLLQQLQEEWPEINSNEEKWSLEPLLYYALEATSETHSQQTSPPASGVDLTPGLSTSNAATHED